MKYKLFFLQENARESELELREDIDLANAENRKLERAREVAHEVIADHESTVHKFAQGLGGDKKLLAIIKKDKMAPFYRSVCKELKWKEDSKLWT